MKCLRCDEVGVRVQQAYRLQGGQHQAVFWQSPVGKMGLYISNSVIQANSAQVATDHSPLPSSITTHPHSSFWSYTTPMSEFEPLTVGITGKEAQRDE
jgi:hypothetical protein